ncbi:MAG: hypothetical protein ABSG51_10950 [Terracidiphilus sp.]
MNLFVGKNNTGKTCLLEAVELYTSSSPWDVLRVASRREPDGAKRGRIGRYDPFEPGDPIQPIINLFHREHGPSDFRIRLSAGRPEADFKLECAPFPPGMLETDLFSAEDGKPSLSHRMLIRHLLEDGFELTRGEKKSGPIFFERYLRRPQFAEEMMKEEGWLHPDVAPVAFLPARGFTNGEAKRLWDKASLTDKDDLLLDWLWFIEPEVRDLRYISDSDSGGDLPFLKINGDRGRTPLASMGDGLTRLFHIGLAMTNASGGRLHPSLR